MLKEQTKEEWNIDKWEAKSHLKISSSTAIVWNSMTSDGIEWKRYTKKILDMLSD